MKSWQGFLIAFGSFCTFVITHGFFQYFRKRNRTRVVYEPHPDPNHIARPALSPIPTHPEKVLDWYKKHVYWDPTVPSPERIELLHQWQENKRKTRRANALTV